MTFSVKPNEPLTIDDHRELYGNPLLAFAIFAADQADDLTRESYYNPERERGIVVLEYGREPLLREWRPVPGRYLFQAEDIPDIGAALTKWFNTWRKSFPSLGLFREVIEQGNTYSAPRFLTLYTAAEQYWKSTKVGNAPWSPRELEKRAGVSADVTGATDQALALIGATRKYHAHLSIDSDFSPDTIVNQTYESTRRLHALVQACLMREIGLETHDIERLMTQHYLSWPIP